jgi:hypothetical protein
METPRRPWRKAMTPTQADWDAEIDRRAKSTCEKLGIDPNLILDEYGPVRAHDVVEYSLREVSNKAELRGIKLGLEAAAKACDDVVSPFDHHTHTPEDCAFYDATEMCEQAIRTLDPAAVQRGE